MTLPLPLLIEPDELVQALETPDATPLLIVDLCSEANYQTGHIPGAIFIPPQALMDGTPPAAGRVPSEERLSQLFSHMGLTPQTHVVVYDDEGGGWAGRLIWTLDVIGHSHYSCLNGGRHAWIAAGLALEKTVNQPQASDYTVTIDPSPIAEIDDILPRLDDDSLVIWDARSPAEYRGEKVLAMKGGHIPGAINCEWTTLMDPQRQLRLRTDAADILATLGITKDKDIITHCQSHHRSAFAYLVGKILGYRIRGYHGSWSEWGNHPGTPVEQ